MKWHDPFQKWLASIARKRPKVESTSPAAGWIVDLVGPSGVGKSVFYKKMFSDLKSDGEASWFSSRGLTDIIRRHRRDKPELSMPLSLLDSEAEAFVGRLLKKKYDYLHGRADIALARKVYFYEYFLKAMELDVVMQFSRQPKGLVADDSVAHIFTNEIVELHDSARAAQDPCDDGLARFFEKRALILLSASLETILENLRKRSVEHPGALNDWYSLYGEANLSGPVQADREMKDRLAKIAEHFGAQILVLKAEDGIEANSRRARQFLHTLVESGEIDASQSSRT